MLPSGRQIKVVDTPGIMDTKGRDVRDEVVKAIAALSPGPHAIIIVLQPGRATKEEGQAIEQLKEMFGDEAFLRHTLIVMTKKSDIVCADQNDSPVNIHSFIATKAAAEVKQLYEKCGRRIIAVENTHSSSDKKKEYAMEVTNEVLKMGGYYSHSYFQLLAEKNIQAKEIQKLRNELDRIVKEKRRSFCTIL